MVNVSIDAKTKARWTRDAICKATPVARRWAVARMKNGDDFGDFEPEFMDVIFVELRLYEQMKQTLYHNVQLHGLDAVAQGFFDEFIAIKDFNRNQYAQIMKKVRKAYAKDSGNRYLEYLISKLNEYIGKVQDLGRMGYQLLADGKSPDFESWSDKVAINDTIFEENKQFLKQTLHHLDCLERTNSYEFGVSDLRILLYHKDGCRREKLYRQAEIWIIKIYNQLKTEQERRSVYKEICDFVADLVPSVGYISPGMISFIFDREYLSAESRDLLVKIKPVITNLGMTPLIIRDLLIAYEKLAARVRRKDDITESDEFVMQIMQLYAPKQIDVDVEYLWEIAHGQQEKEKTIAAFI